MDTVSLVGGGGCWYYNDASHFTAGPYLGKEVSVCGLEALRLTVPYLHFYLSHRSHLQLDHPRCLANIPADSAAAVILGCKVHRSTTTCSM